MLKKITREYKTKDTIIKINKNLEIGGEKTVIIAGPCAIESEKQLFEIAYFLKNKKVDILRRGAFKPRTSPYSFQGLGIDGIELLKKVKLKLEIPVITEITSLDYLDEYIKYIDIIQVGARNMQNFELLKRLGKTQKPILLKRHFSATIEEFLDSAEYILSEGNENVILCERGIRTFENCTRNTLDLSVVPILKKKTHLPIIIDPSHATGKAWLVPWATKAAMMVQPNGLMIEVHSNPKMALCDGEQSLNFMEFENLMKDIFKIKKEN